MHEKGRITDEEFTVMAGWALGMYTNQTLETAMADCLKQLAEKTAR
jgi:hypothetical protein